MSMQTNKKWHRQLARLVEQYDEFYPALLKMIAALESVEPGGTLTDKMVIDSKKHGKVAISYCAKPLYVTLEHAGKKYIFKIVDA
jgi:hypothetical protein